MSRLNDQEKDDQGNRARILDNLARTYAMLGKSDLMSENHNETQSNYTETMVRDH